jgi:hypothetical protein
MKVLRQVPVRAGAVPVQGGCRAEDNGMKILVLFRWAKRRILLVITIRLR